MIGNVVWADFCRLIFAAWWLALGHLVTAILLAVTIAGIPFAWGTPEPRRTGAVANWVDDQTKAGCSLTRTPVREVNPIFLGRTFLRTRMRE